MTTQTGAMTADHLAALIAQHGLGPIASMIANPGAGLVRSVVLGIPPPVNWGVSQTGGAVLFYQTTPDGVITGEERLLYVNAPEVERSRWAVLCADSDAPVRLLLREQWRRS